MNNMSGNFNTAISELAVVEQYLKNMGIDTKQCKIQKYGETFGEDNKTDKTNSRSSGDIYVTLPDKTVSLFEVKEEDWENRFKIHKQLGIDFISAFHYKENLGLGKNYFHPCQYDDFIKQVDIKSGFKWGKLANSYADVWLFYSINKSTSQYMFVDGYDARKIRKSNQLFHYLVKNCDFAVNKKGPDQMSYTDTWKSAVFFVDKKYMDENYKINSVNELRHVNFTEDALKGNNG